MAPVHAADRNGAAGMAENIFADTPLGDQTLAQAFQQRLQFRAMGRRHAKAEIGDIAFRKQPGIAAGNIGREEDVGRIMGRVERHRDLARFDQIGVHEPDGLADARARPVGTDQ